jgi:hypothetical protein
VRPDEERKVQLEKDAGAVSQFVMQVKTLADDIRASKELDTPIKIDGGELIQGVQGLIDVIREIKEQRDATDPKELRQPRESRKQQRKQRQADHKI